MRRFVWVLAVVLALLHYDFWYWNDRTLVFGFMPVGLAYQAVYSLLCGLTWYLAVVFAWPTHIEEWASDEGWEDAEREVSA